MINFVPIPVFTAVDEDGVPLVGGKLYTYATGTTTPKATYTDVTKGTPNTNPIILDDNGQAHVWIDAADGSYRFVLTDADDVELWARNGIVAPGGEVSAVLTVSGDILYASGAGVLARLAKGTARYSLQMDAAGAYPNWVASPNSVLTAQGDTLYASAANVIARLGIGTALQGLQVNAAGQVPEWVASPQSVLTAKGDTLHASAANTLAKLAIGTIGQKLFVNAAGDLPEWGAGFKLGLTTYDTSVAPATQAITGVGFKPTLVLMLVQVPGSAGEMCIGIDNGTLAYCLYDDHNNTANAYANNVIRSIYLDEGAGVYGRAYITTLGSDGFTLTWDKTGAKTGTAQIIYLAMR